MATEFMRCPSHEHQQPDDPTLDYWETVGSDRCCSYCGSWHPDEFLAFLKVVASPNQPGHIEGTRKNYKIYLHRPGISHAGQGAIKFYKWHLPAPVDEETEALYREAMEVGFRKMMSAMDKWCIDMGMGNDRAN